jgi:hypothetical protein
MVMPQEVLVFNLVGRGVGTEKGYASPQAEENQAVHHCQRRGNTAAMSLWILLRTSERMWRLTERGSGALGNGYHLIPLFLGKRTLILMFEPPVLCTVHFVGVGK